MDSLMRLRQAWDRAIGSCPVSGHASSEAFDRLASAYGAPDRHYHGSDHIAALLGLAEVHAELVDDKPAIDLAILFHDVVYDPRRGDNEAASARVAETLLAQLGLDVGVIAKVAGYVRATAHGANADGGEEPDLGFLLDIDLSILAAHPAAYLAYAEAIRREYVHVAMDDYRRGRTHILRQFLARNQIYGTPRLWALWEAAARSNLAAELAVLDNGVGLATDR